MCCLRYEQDSYRRFMIWVPGVGETVVTERGEARVVAHDVMSEKVTLELEGGERFTLPASYFGPEPAEVEIEIEESEDEIVEDTDMELDEDLE
jgi:cell fate regulator YaaT (PSP1 superfamily)